LCNNASEETNKPRGRETGGGVTASQSRAEAAWREADGREERQEENALKSVMTGNKQVYEETNSSQFERCLASIVASNWNKQKLRSCEPWER
jgi:hypothetical protein